MRPGLTINSLPYRARVVPARIEKGVEMEALEGVRYAVGVMGAGSRMVGPWDNVMLEGVSEPLNACSVRLYFFATWAARDDMCDFTSEELAPTLMR